MCDIYTSLGLSWVTMDLTFCRKLQRLDLDSQRVS